MHPKVLDALVEAVPSEDVDELMRMSRESDLYHEPLCSVN
jgi:hypothetical protein